MDTLTDRHAHKSRARSTLAHSYHHRVPLPHLPYPLTPGVCVCMVQWIDGAVERSHHSYENSCFLLLKSYSHQSPKT